MHEVALPHLKIELPGQAHTAPHDAAATAMIMKKLAELADQELAPGWHPPVLVRCAGCHQVVRECAEADEVWYCQHCGLEQGVFHHCPGCNHVVETPATGYISDDLCIYCQKFLHQEKMLLTGAWHRCPDCIYAIVQTADLEEPCPECQRRREWKRKQEEAECVRQARIEQERKEHRRAYAQAYRKLRKELEQENRQRAALGLPPVEVKQTKPVEEIIHYHGHQFQRRKDAYGKFEVYCLVCEAVWRNVPRSWCAGMKAYRSWTDIPEHLKTQTQLLKLQLTPVKGQRPAAVMEGYFGRYRLYDKHTCVEVPRRAREKA